MKRRLVWMVIAVCQIVQSLSAAEERYDPKRWEEAIQAFEKQDAEQFPPEDAILFTGSSSIRMWDLKTWFPELKAINRGFGGSHIEDSIYYADRIVLPYRPRIVLLYAGDNDIAGGKSPERVAADFKTFVKAVHKTLPDTRIGFICIKPSIRRWNLIEPMRKANRLIQDFTKTDKRLFYIDIDTPMIGEDGRPKADLFLDDGLHLNEAGYRLWSEIVKRTLATNDPKP